MAIVFDDEKPNKIVFDDEESNKSRYWDDVKNNAIGDLKGFKDSGIELVKHPIKSFEAITDLSPTVSIAKFIPELLSGTDPKETAAYRNINDIPKAVLKKAYEYVTEPKESFREHPVNMALDVSSVVAPALKGAELAASVSKLPKVAEAIEMAGKAPAWISKKAIRTVLGPSEEAVAARFANPEALKAASETRAAERLAGKLQGMGKEIGELSGKAEEIVTGGNSFGQPDLFGPGSMEKNKLKGIITSIKNNIASKTNGVAISKETQNAFSRLDDIMAKVEEIKHTKAKTPMAAITNSRLSPENVLGIKKELNSILGDAYKNPISGTEESALKMVNKSLNKKLATIPGYSEAMEPIRERMAVRDYLVNKMGITKEGGNFSPSDRTINAMKRTLDEEKALQSSQKMAEFDRITGAGIKDEMRNAKLAKEFEGGRPQGSRNTLLGFFTGMLPGATTGAAIDRFGGNMAGVMVDAASKTKQIVGGVAGKATDLMESVKLNPEKFGRYAPTMMRWASAGAPAFAVNHYLTAQKDPQYHDLTIKGQK